MQTACSFFSLLVLRWQSLDWARLIEQSRNSSVYITVGYPLWRLSPCSCLVCGFAPPVKHMSPDTPQQHRAPENTASTNVHVHRGGRCDYRYGILMKGLMEGHRHQTMKNQLKEEGINGSKVKKKDVVDKEQWKKGWRENNRNQVAGSKISGVTGRSNQMGEGKGKINQRQDWCKQLEKRAGRSSSQKFSWEVWIKSEVRG